MTFQTRSNDTDDAQRHKNEAVYLALANTFLVLSTLLLCYIAVRYLRFQARTLVQPPVTSIPRRLFEVQAPLRRFEVQDETDSATQSVIPLQEVTIHHIDSMNQEPSHDLEQQTASILKIPAELRLQIYSYLLPDVMLASVCRKLRQTCRQIYREIEYEARVAFTDRMRLLQQVADADPLIISFSYSAETYHVEMVLQLPQPYLVGRVEPSTPPTKTYLDARVLAFIERFPLNTCSATIILQAHPQGTLSARARYLDDMWSLLHKYLELRSRFAMQGGTEMRSLTLLWRAPKVLVPGIRFGGFMRKLNWVTALGVRFRYNRNFQLVTCHLFDPRQRYLPFIKWLLGLSKLQTTLQVV